MNALVGYTGFVGSNIFAKGKIDKAFNSKNINEAYGLKPDVLIYAGLRAEKYLANNAPERDMEQIYQAMENIEKISPDKLVLISTIDVFKNPVGVDENSEIECDGLHAYGLNRYRMECMVREKYKDALIIRLPGLFGINIKKNFIYDFINIIPFMLRKDKLEELSGQDDDLRNFYKCHDNGFYRCIELNRNEKKKLQEKFKKLGFTALNFTDSRSIYQFYPLERLWDDIQKALKYDIRLFHPATEPVSAAELYKYLTGNEFKNEMGKVYAFYDYRTIYSEMFGGKNGYILTRDQVLEAIAYFVRGCGNC